MNHPDVLFFLCVGWLRSVIPDVEHVNDNDKQIKKIIGFKNRNLWRDFMNFPYFSRLAEPCMMK